MSSLALRFPQQRNAAATLTAATIIVSSLFSILPRMLHAALLYRHAARD